MNEFEILVSINIIEYRVELIVGQHCRRIILECAEIYFGFINLKFGKNHVDFAGRICFFTISICTLETEPFACFLYIKALGIIFFARDFDLSTKGDINLFYRDPFNAIGAFINPKFAG